MDKYSFCSCLTCILIIPFEEVNYNIRHLIFGNVATLIVPEILDDK